MCPERRGGYLDETEAFVDFCLFTCAVYMRALRLLFPKLVNFHFCIRVRSFASAQTSAEYAHATFRISYSHCECTVFFPFMLSARSRANSEVRSHVNSCLNHAQRCRACGKLDRARAVGVRKSPRWKKERKRERNRW